MRARLISPGILLLALVFATAPAALASTAATRTGAVHEDSRRFVLDLGRAFRHELAPTTAGRATYLAGLAAASIALERHKESYRQDVLRSHLFADSSWTDVGGKLGLTRNAEVVTAAFYLGGLVARAPRVRGVGLLLAESLLATHLTEGALNYTFSEERPQAGGTVRTFHTGGHSASVHMTNTMAVARVLDHELAAAAPGNRAVDLLRVGVYAIPAVTGWERLRADQHYLWNVVLGAGASLYVTNAVLRAHDGGASAGHESRLLLEPMVPARGRGGGLAIRWSRR